MGDVRNAASAHLVGHHLRSRSKLDRHLEKGAERALTCVLLDKPARRVADIRPDYIGFTIEDRFVVGYGLDAAGEHRCLPYVAILEE